MEAGSGKLLEARRGEGTSVGKVKCCLGGLNNFQVENECKGTVSSEAGDLSEPAVHRKSRRLTRI